MNKLSLDSRSPALRRRSGFTIVELLAVVMIMAILGAIVLGIAGYATRRASDAEARADLQLLRTALEGYRISHGTYPTGNMTTFDQWQALGPALTNNTELDISFEDPWGTPYYYEAKRPPGQTTGRVSSYDLWSWGPSGGPQGAAAREGEDYEYDIIR